MLSWHDSCVLLPLPSASPFSVHCLSSPPAAVRNPGRLWSFPPPPICGFQLLVGGLFGEIPKLAEIVSAKPQYKLRREAPELWSRGLEGVSVGCSDDFILYYDSVSLVC